MKTIDDQIAALQRFADDSVRFAASSRSVAEHHARAATEALARVQELKAQRDPKANRTYGQEIAEHVFRIGDGWLMMERVDQPGHPRNLFLFTERPNHDSPEDLLPMMRDSLACLIDRECARAAEKEREACARLVKEWGANSAALVHVGAVCGELARNIESRK